MPGMPDRIGLQSFNNLTKVVSFNLYHFYVAPSEDTQRQFLVEINARYSADRLTQFLREVAKLIDAEVLSVSTQDYEPQGASSLVLMSDLSHCYTGVGAHLTKSHLCAHTYPDWTHPSGICSFRVDIDVATCGTIVPLRVLDYMLRSFANDLVIIDYVVRGFTRDADGQRVGMDHSLGSIRDFIDPTLLRDYHAEDMVLQSERIWRTKLMRTRLDPHQLLARGREAPPDEISEALAAVQREMTGIFYGWPG